MVAGPKYRFTNNRNRRLETDDSVFVHAHYIKVVKLLFVKDQTITFLFGQYICESKTSLIREAGRDLLAIDVFVRKMRLQRLESTMCTISTSNLVILGWTALSPRYKLWESPLKGLPSGEVFTSPHQQYGFFISFTRRGLMCKIMKVVCKPMDDAVTVRSSGTLYSTVLYRPWIGKMSDGTWVSTCLYRETRAKWPECVTSDATDKHRTCSVIFDSKDIEARITEKRKKTGDDLSFLQLWSVT